MGRGEPLALRRIERGGVGGIGRGEPLALRRTERGGVGGMGRGEPLAMRRMERGGVGGIGRGDPLSMATETAPTRLLDKCLTELLTGSTIKTATTSIARRAEMFFIMDEPLLAQP